MPPGRLPREVFQACPTGRRPQGKTQDTLERLCLSTGLGQRLGIPPEELEEVSGDTVDPAQLCTAPAQRREEKVPALYFSSRRSYPLSIRHVSLQSPERGGVKKREMVSEEEERLWKCQLPASHNNTLECASTLVPNREEERIRQRGGGEALNLSSSTAATPVVSYPLQHALCVCDGGPAETKGEGYDKQLKEILDAEILPMVKEFDNKRNYGS
ncbi:hypothetical protein L3Q82_002344 [Scortum barcoo]|uniref:Uncharacterized protein n=1 Tax=Scortum barcoo TaxID=214431 RepID=A0ACB8VY76_9TELE|nr:hypothetical protein L3Q82_002344 [Scortum barcoo]